MTEDQMAAYLANHLLHKRFRSKRRMADSLKIPYRTIAQSMRRERK